MMKENGISIIIHSRNNPNILREVLESLCKQMIPAREVIIVHTGPVKIDEQMIHSYRHRLPLQYFFEPEKRASYARNKGVAVSCGSIIAFLDDDCVPCKKWTTVIERTFEERAEIQVLQGNILFSDSIHSIWAEIHAVNYQRTMGSMLEETSGYINTLNAKHFAIRGKLIRRFRMPFDERLEMNDDVELYWKLQQERIPVVYSEELQVRQFQSRSLKELILNWYRYGIGKAQLRRIHDDFWDSFCVSLDSFSSVWSWFYREMVSSWLKKYVKFLLKKRRGLTAMIVYLVVCMQRIAFLSGFFRGQKKKLPVYDHFVTPLDLQFFLTNTCNLRCKHCFFHESLDSPTRPVQKIHAQYIIKMLKSLNRDLRTVSMGGGEPFLNDQITDICRALAERIHVKNVYIITNGFDLSGIVKSVEEILKTVNYNLFIRVSLDGLQATHNRIRKHPRAFGNAIKTVRALSHLARGNNRFQVQVQTTIGRDNFDELEPLAKFVAQELKVFQAFEIIRDLAMFAHNPDFMQTSHGLVGHPLLTAITGIGSLFFFWRYLHEDRTLGLPFLKICQIGLLHYCANVVFIIATILGALKHRIFLVPASIFRPTNPENS